MAVIRRSARTPTDDMNPPAPNRTIFGRPLPQPNAPPSPPAVLPPPGPEENNPEPPAPPPPPNGAPQPYLPVTPQATGNYQADILGYLRQNHPGATPQDLNNALPTLQAMYPGLELHNGGQSGKIRLPDGRIVDIGLSFGIGGGQGWWWGEDAPGGGQPQMIDEGGVTLPDSGFLPPVSPVAPRATPQNTLIPAATSPTAIEPTATSTPQFTPFATTPNRGAADQAFASRIQDLLLQMMNRSQSPSATDPEIALPTNAYRAGQQRSSERQKAELAERASFEGYSDSGAFDTERRGIDQARGQNEAAFEAGLYQDAASRRLTELTQVAALGSQYLSQQDQNQLQREITALQQQIEQARLAQNQTQFTSNLGENRRQFDSSFNENRRQFDTSTAQQQAIEEARLNYQSLLAALGAR